MKGKKIKAAVAKGLSDILLSLSIGNPSGKTRNYIKKVAKKLSKQLKADAKASGKKRSKKTKSAKVVRAKTKVATKKPSEVARKKK